jgi:hypothetical protein
MQSLLSTAGRLIGKAILAGQDPLRLRPGQVEAEEI